MSKISNVSVPEDYFPAAEASRDVPETFSAIADLAFIDETFPGKGNAHKRAKESAKLSL
jgi:hypothetical protein